MNITDPTEHWASLDQFTSFAKDPWGFDRPENRKGHNLLSQATFAEWPNTTSNFSLHRGVAPPGKLATHHKSRFLEVRPGESEKVSSTEQQAITKKIPSRAISDEQLRASVCTNNGVKPPDRSGSCTARTITTATPRAPPRNTTARDSADNVTAAYTLLEQVAAEQMATSSTKNGTARRTASRTTALSVNQGTPPPQRQRAEQQQDQGGRRQQSSALSHNWSMTNIGFNNIKSEARSRIERENRDGYEQASFASRDADKSYIAEAAHFWFRYPHTLGRIQALSRVRSDRADARRDRVRASNSRKKN